MASRSTWGLLPLLCIAACTGDDAPDSGTDALAQVDVLVIGSGPSGLAAAIEAQRAGAEVLLIERSSQAGGAGWYAGNFFAVGTPLQEQVQVSDSPEQALSEWAEFTNGGDPEDPWVQRLIYESAETLVWLEEFGVDFNVIVDDPAAGETDRLHINTQGPPSLAPLIDEVQEIWLNTQAEELLLDGGAVIGARVTRLESGEEGWIQARSTIVATGGFARDLDRVRQDRPEFEDLALVYEAAPTSVGLGLEMLEGAGAQIHNQGNFGVYFHSLADPREERPKEALWVIWLQQSMIVGSSGRRVVDETEIRGFQMVDHFLESEGQQLWLFGTTQIAESGLAIPAYLWEDRDQQESLSTDEAVALGALTQADTVLELAEILGIDGPGLVEEVDAYRAMVAGSEDTAFGKDPRWLINLGNGPYVGAPLVPGPAKAFVGTRIDDEARVLDSSGDVIPGLFAVGEAAGFLGSDAVGDGFSGSITACYLTGRVAGMASLD